MVWSTKVSPEVVARLTALRARESAYAARIAASAAAAKEVASSPASLPTAPKVFKVPKGGGSRVVTIWGVGLFKPMVQSSTSAREAREAKEAKEAKEEVEAPAAVAVVDKKGAHTARATRARPRARARAPFVRPDEAKRETWTPAEREMVRIEEEGMTGPMRPMSTLQRKKWNQSGIRPTEEEAAFYHTRVHEETCLPFEEDGGVVVDATSKVILKNILEHPEEYTEEQLKVARDYLQKLPLTESEELELLAWGALAPPSPPEGGKPPLPPITRSSDDTVGGQGGLPPVGVIGGISPLRWKSPRAWGGRVGYTNDCSSAVIHSKPFTDDELNGIRDTLNEAIKQKVVGAGLLLSVGGGSDRGKVNIKLKFSGRSERYKKYVPPKVRERLLRLPTEGNAHRIWEPTCVINRQGTVSIMGNKLPVMSGIAGRILVRILNKFCAGGASTPLTPLGDGAVGVAAGVKGAVAPSPFFFRKHRTYNTCLNFWPDPKAWSGVNLPKLMDGESYRNNKRSNKRKVDEIAYEPEMDPAVHHRPQKKIVNRIADNGNITSVGGANLTTVLESIIETMNMLAVYKRTATGSKVVVASASADSKEEKKASASCDSSAAEEEAQAVILPLVAADATATASSTEERAHKRARPMSFWEQAMCASGNGSSSSGNGSGAPSSEMDAFFPAPFSIKIPSSMMSSSSSSTSTSTLAPMVPMTPMPTLSVDEIMHGCDILLDQENK